MACWLPFGLLFSLLVMLRAPVDGGCCISSVNFLFWLMFYGGWKALRWGYTVPPPTAVERGPWCLGWQVLPVSQCEGLLVDNVLDATMTGSFQSNFGHFQPWMPCWIIVHMPLHHPYISPCVHFVPFSWADWEKKKKKIFRDQGTIFPYDWKGVVTRCKSQLLIFKIYISRWFLQDLRLRMFSTTWKRSAGNTSM